MRLAYLTMQTPAPSEVFLSVEIRHLAKFAQLYIFCLREPHERHQDLIREQKLSGIPIYYFAYFFSWKLWRDVLYWSRQQPFIWGEMILLISKLCWKKPKFWLLSLLILPKSFSIVRQIEINQIEILHLAWGHYPAITAYLLKKLLPQVHLTMGLGAYDRLAQHPMTPLAANLADYILTQNPASAEVIKKDWPRPKTEVISIVRGVDTDMVRMLPNVEKKAGLIVSSARLVEEKGHQYVIKAFAEIYPQYPHIRLLILGEGEYRAKLENLIKDLNLTTCVELVGHLPQEEAFQVMASASFFVLATTADYENLPNSIKEAMALGLPVVTTPSLGIEALVETGRTGIFVPQHDVKALRAAMEDLLENLSRCEILGQNAAKRIEETFSIAHTTQQRIVLYKHLLER